MTHLKDYMSLSFELKDILPGTALKYSHRLRLL